MTQTGNRLDQKAPEADEALRETPPNGIPVTATLPVGTAPAHSAPAHAAPARAPVRTPAVSDGRPPRPNAGSPHRTKLSARGRVVFSVLGVVVVMAVVLGSGVLTSGPSTAPPAQARVVANTPAASVAFAAAGAWLADDHAGTLRHFDPASGATIGRALHLGGRPISVVSGFGAIWVADIAGSILWEVNPANGKVVGDPIAVPQGPVSLAAGQGGVWVASLVARTVSLVDPRTGAVRASATLPDGAVRITLGPDGVWVSGQTNSLVRVDPRPVGSSLRFLTVTVGQGPFGVGVGDGSVWVANVKSGSVSRVDPASVRVTATYTVGGSGGGVPTNPEMVAVWHGRVWVADGRQGVVVALDPDTGAQIGGPVPLPGVIRQLALDGAGNLWGTTANPGTVVRFS